VKALADPNAIHPASSASPWDAGQSRLNQSDAQNKVRQGGAALGQHSEYRPPQGLQIQGERPILDAPTVEADPAFSATGVLKRAGP
jgi:hypothetical protein